MNIHTGKTVYHPEFGAGRVVNMEPERIVVSFIRSGVKYFNPAEAEEMLGETPPEDEDPGGEPVEMEDLKAAIREVLREEGVTGETVMAEKWEGGRMILMPGKPGLQEKEIPVDSVFHKIVMIRDRLRVLEQNINSHEKLSDADKINLQQYVTRCYGSLTTFNVLFADKRDWFVGEKSK